MDNTRPRLPDTHLQLSGAFSMQVLYLVLCLFYVIVTADHLFYFMCGETQPRRW